MKLKKVLCSVLALAMVLSTMSFTVFAEDTDIIEVGTGKANETWSSAIAAAVDGDEDGTITYHVYGKVVLDAYSIKGAAETINIIGKTEDAELCVDTTGVGNIRINDNNIKTVNFENLTLSRLNGSWSGDVDNTNKFFTVWTYQSNAQQVNYTNCVFPNGTANAYPGKTVYTECDFCNESDFGLWIYAKGETVVTDSAFTGYAGLKTYGYAGQTEMTTTITETSFAVTDKPAAVVSGLGTVELTNVEVEDCTYGVWEVAAVGGTTAAVTLDDVAPTFVAQCQDKYGSTVYVTNADYAETVVETANSTANSAIDNVAKVVSDGYATYYASLHAAATAAQSGDVVEVLKDETVGTWNSIWNKDGITINGNNHTLTVGAVDSDINGSGLFLAAKNLTINDLNVVLPTEVTNGERPRLATMESGELNNVSVSGGNHAVSIIGTGSVSINDCTFENIDGWAIETESRSTSAEASLTISDSTFDEKAVIIRGENTTFTGNKIANAGEGVNVLGNATITGNDFGESTLGIDQGRTVTIENNIINNVEFPNWYGVEEEDYSDLTVEENTMSDEAVAAFNDKLAEDVVSVDYVATIGDKFYYSIEEAIAAAGNNDTIVLLEDATLDTYSINGINLTIDLNDYTLYRADSDNNKTTRANHNDGAVVTYKNGTINIDDAVESVAIFGTNVYTGTTAASMIFDDVVINGDGYDSGYAVFYLDDALENSLTITNSTINLANEQGPAGGVIKSEDANANVSISNTTMTLENVQRGFVNSEYTIDESDIEFKNMNKTALRNFSGTITDSEIDIDNADYGIENDSSIAKEISVAGTTSIQITNSKTLGIAANTNTTITVAETAELLADSTNIESEIDGDVVSKADTIYVQYKKTDIDADDNDTVEGQDKYEIVLAGADSETINELASADLTFEFVGTPANAGAMNYTVLPADGVTLSQIGDRYMFNYDGITKYEETAAEIVIGTITIDGYGTYTLKTANADTNAVYATEIRDNIVDGFEDAATLNINNDMVADDGMVGEITDGEIAIPTRELAINITFPNSIVYNDAAYQDMTVTIAGGTYKEEIELGAEETYAITRNLAYNTTYTVTVEGAGYRTARYSVVLTEDKVLNFWNNVKDNAMEVEEGKATSAVTKNFLAGDIVKDNNINVYDLSAVVSYFGEENLVSDHPEYAKYDLNRDGVIDSKDVAYVLVSWGE